MGLQSGEQAGQGKTLMLLACKESLVLRVLHVVERCHAGISALDVDET